MIDTKSLTRATLIGTALQLAMVVAGHHSAWVALHVFMFGGMAISALAGLLYANAAASGYGGGALGGAVAGGLCALIGIVLSVVLGDTAPLILAVGTLSSAITGAIGGLIGQATARAAS